MKKIISLLSAVAMLAMAVPASAALEYEYDGSDYIIAALPTEAEVEAYEPKVNATATKITSVDELTAIDTDMASIGITTKAQKKYQNKLTTYDVYKMTVEVTGLGTLVNGYNEDYDDTYFGIYDITIGYDPSNLPAGYELYPLSYTLPGERGQAGVAISSQNGNLNTVFNAGGVKASETYPAQNTAVEDATCKFEYLLIYAATTESVSLPYASSKITYQLNAKAPATTNVTGNNVVLGGTVVPPAPAETKVVLSDKMDLDKDGVIGAAWDVTIENYDSEKDYMVTLKDGEEVRGGKAVALTGLNTVTEVEGDVSFALLVELSKARPALELAIEIQ